MFYIMATKTIRGFVLGECISAFQKAVRRSDEEGAVCWGVEIDQSGFGAMLWSRMMVIASEDIGLAEPNLPANMRALYESWKEFKARKNPHMPERLFTMHAIMMLARAEKSRRVDVAIAGSYCCEDPIRDEIPDYALDGHTARGRRLGRGKKFWDEHSVVLVNEADLGDDPWPARRERQQEEWAKKQGLEDRPEKHGGPPSARKAANGKGGKAKSLTEERKEELEAELQEAVERAEHRADEAPTLGI